MTYRLHTPTNGTRFLSPLKYCSTSGDMVEAYFEEAIIVKSDKHLAELEKLHTIVKD